jgi:hypothetical protein
MIVTTPPPVAIDTNDQLSPLHTAEEYGYSTAASAQQTSIKADPMAVDSGPLLSWPHSSAPQQPHQQANQNSSAPRQEKISFSHLAADLASSAVRNLTQAMHRAVTPLAQRKDGRQAKHQPEPAAVK